MLVKSGGGSALIGGGSDIEIFLRGRSRLCTGQQYSSIVSISVV